MNNSIFGAGAPKFVHDLGGENEATVLLDHWIQTNDGLDTKEKQIESELEASRDYIVLGDFLQIEGRVNLYAFGALTAIRSKFEEIYQFNNTDVVLYKHRDGQPFKDSSGNNVLFRMHVTPKNLTTLDYRDILIINFRSLTAVDYSESSAVLPQLSEIVMSNTY